MRAYIYHIHVQSLDGRIDEEKEEKSRTKTHTYTRIATDFVEIRKFFLILTKHYI